MRRLPATRGRLLTLGLAAVAIAELSTTIPFLPRRDVPRAYKVLASAEPGAVLELPFYHRPHERFRQTLYMLGSTAHWQPLVGGYSDFIPADFFEGAPLLETFPNAEAFAWLRQNRPVGLIDVERFDPFWAITKHADILEISRNPDLFHALLKPAQEPRAPEPGAKRSHRGITSFAEFDAAFQENLRIRAWDEWAEARLIALRSDERARAEEIARLTLHRTIIQLKLRENLRVKEIAARMGMRHHARAVELWAKVEAAAEAAPLDLAVLSRPCRCGCGGRITQFRSTGRPRLYIDGTHRARHGMRVVRRRRRPGA